MNLKITENGLPYDDFILLEGETVPVVFTPNGTPIPVDHIIDSTKSDIIYEAEAKDPSVSDFIDAYRKHIKYVEARDVLTQVQETLNRNNKQAKVLQKYAQDIFGDML